MRIYFTIILVRSPRNPSLIIKALTLGFEALDLFFGIHTDLVGVYGRESFGISGPDISGSIAFGQDLIRLYKNLTGI